MRVGRLINSLQKIAAGAALTLSIGFANAAPQQSPPPPTVSEAKPATADTAPAGTNAPAAEDLIARKFVQMCAGCHTIGGGKRTGPDLVTSIAWPVPDLKKGVKNMEKNVGPMTDETLDAFVALLKSPEVKPRLTAAEQQIAAMFAARMAPASAELGAKLFRGSAPFANGGLACIACHAVDGHGGNLGPELNGVHQKLGTTALVSAIEKAGFKIMEPAYRHHPVTAQEALHLAKYFETLNPQAPRLATSAFLPAGAALATALLLGMTFYYRQNRANNHAPLPRRRK
jgi:cytochrome c553